MKTIFLILLGIFYIGLTILMCLQESRNRKVNFFIALLICILITPFFGYFVLGSFAARNPTGCKWCGNKYNEAEFCGLCGKNEAGETRESLKLKSQQV